MVADPKDRLHRLIESLSDHDARALSATLHPDADPSPLQEEDIILPEAILPDDESADMLIATILRWRHDDDA